MSARFRVCIQGWHSADLAGAALELAHSLHTRVYPPATDRDGRTRYLRETERETAVLDALLRELRQRMTEGRS